MRITIAHRFLPYCHEEGFRVLIPRTSAIVEVFPTLLTLYTFVQGGLHPVTVVPIAVSGPVRNFSAILDLERGLLRVSGHSHDGYFRYRVGVSDDGALQYLVEKEPSALPLLGLEPLSLPFVAIEGQRPRERLSFGCHKAQEWPSIRRRALMAEWMPLWHWLGQWLATPTIPIHTLAEELSLMGALSSALQRGDSSLATTTLKELYHVAFTDLFVPNGERWRLLGSSLPPTLSHDTLDLVRYGSLLIRAFFFHYAENENVVTILPHLPQELHCGRYLSASCGSVADLDFEWSKHRLRRLIIHAKEGSVMTLRWHKPLKTCRLRSDKQPAARILTNGQQLNLLAGERYYLDRFES